MLNLTTRIKHPVNIKQIFLFILIIPVFNNSLGQTIIIPSSRRSQEAIQKVKPKLQNELNWRCLQFGSPIYIRIFKQSHEFELWVKNQHEFILFKTYKICYFSGNPGPKLRQGDCQSPEGFYFVTPNRLNPSSMFHLSFNIGYPNAYDRFYNRTGSAIMIHGNCVSIGCYAMTDSLIEEIYALADIAFKNGQSLFRVHIFPFRMTKKNMEKHRDSEWISFWQNLKEGYDYFENRKLPPNTDIRNGKYVFW